MNDFLEDPQNICNQIRDVTTNGDTIQISFHKTISSYNPWKIASYFSFLGIQFHSELFCPQKSITNAYFFDNNTLAINFPLLFVQENPGLLFCAKSSNNFKDQQATRYKYVVKLHLTNFKENSKYTQLKCFGDPIQHCLARNISTIGPNLIINYPCNYKFPEQFLSLGARINNSFAKYRAIDSTQVLQQNNPMQTSIDYVKDNLVLFGTVGVHDSRNSFLNRLIDVYMPIDLMFNAYDPSNKLQHTFIEVENSAENDYFMKIFVNGSYSTRINAHNVLYDNTIIGLSKFDKSQKNNISPYSADSLYIPNSNFKRHFNLSRTENVITFLHDPIMSQSNSTSVINAIKEKFPSYELQVINYSIQMIPRILYNISRSKILFAIKYHGSELAYFMNSGSILVEFSHFNMDCDQRTKILAEAAQIHYIDAKNMVNYDLMHCNENCFISGCINYLEGLHIQADGEYMSPILENMSNLYNV